jgi:toxin ParE1/3/4
MVQIRWTKQATLDLNEIFEYISKDSSHYARLEVVRIKGKTKLLESNLYLGNAVSELGRPEIRQLIHGNYRIIYKLVDNKRIDILTIHHSARDFGKRSIT